MFKRVKKTSQKTQIILTLECNPIRPNRKSSPWRFSDARCAIAHAFAGFETWLLEMPQMDAQKTPGCKESEEVDVCLHAILMLYGSLVYIRAVALHGWND
jgi:hypothetical protein